MKITLKIYFVFITLFTTVLIAGSAPSIIQPGKPGQESVIISSDEAIKIANSTFIEADVKFMQGMIVHHKQALLMSSYAKDRTNNKQILDIAGRIESSQNDEIKFMKKWLLDRNQKVIYIHEGMDHSMHPMNMKGMASEDELNKLKNSTAKSFDKLFLLLMINHHDGALEMVDKLRDQYGSAYDTALDEFVSDVTNDQSLEIERMNKVFVTISDDPRAGLKAGLYDAGFAIKNLKLEKSLKKPDGFYDPNNLTRQWTDQFKEEQFGNSLSKKRENKRYPLLSFSNTDMAFKDNVLVTGSYHGYNIYEINNNGIPELLSSIVCPGGQGDVSIVDNLLLMSVEETRGRLDCGLQGISEEISDQRFRGLRIFDISDLKNPKQVGAVQTCRGSHTHSVVSENYDGKIIVYNSGISRVRDKEELDGCIGNIAGDKRTALFRIDIIEIPINNPSLSRVISSPAVFADDETGILGGLWTGGDHGDDTQKTSATDECHDITVFPSKALAAGACSGNGIIFDISDIFNPKRIDVVTDTGFAYWHSATFNNDGSKVIFTDEWGGGGSPKCKAWDPINWGADAIYNIVDNKLIFKSHYKIPAPQLETENCVAHNGSIIPIPGRDIFVQAWYQGGLSIIDFTDSANPIEIAYFDRGPINEDELISGGYWSTYYYDGFIYGTEIYRGLDVFSLKPSSFISKNEIKAAKEAYLINNNTFNPQQQYELVWSENNTLAKAYLDQMLRKEIISKMEHRTVSSLIDRLYKGFENGNSNDLVFAQLIEFIDNKNTLNQYINDKSFINFTKLVNNFTKDLDA